MSDAKSKKSADENTTMFANLTAEMTAQIEAMTERTALFEKQALSTMRTAVTEVQGLADKAIEFASSMSAAARQAALESARNLAETFNAVTRR